MTEDPLTRIVITRRPDGRWTLLRERSTTGETFTVADLIDAFEHVRAAYFPDGSPRPADATAAPSTVWPRKSA